MKPNTAEGYDPATTLQARATCLYVATKLGDLMDDMVVIGGLVPSLLVPQGGGVNSPEAHVGTMDVDLALDVELLSSGLYEAVADRLRAAGFRRDANDRGNPTRQRWRPDPTRPGVGIDFLVQPTRPGDQGGRLRNLQPDFAAVIVPGLHLAFLDSVSVELPGRTIMGENASRRVRVCGPGAFVVLKALAFRNRGAEKDAYDLYYVLRHYGSGVADVAEPLRSLADDGDVKAAFTVLREDFLDLDGVGPRRAAGFLNAGQPDDDTQADVVGFVARFLRCL